jgi:hypothetical protein
MQKENRKQEKEKKKRHSREQGANMEGGGEELVNVCRDKKWEEAKAMISKNAIWAANNDNVDFLQYMMDAILLHSLRQHHHQQPRKETQRRQQHMLRDAFEKGHACGWTPVHAAAAWGRVQCLAFLVEHAPCGEAVLEVKTMDGKTPAHIAAGNGEVDVLDFIVRNASNGVGVLEVKANSGKTPLDRAADTRRQLVKNYIVKINVIMISSSEIRGYVGDLQSYP